MTAFFNSNAYTHWATCGVGSTVTTEDITEITMDVGVIRNVVFTKHTLLALDSEKASVEIEVHGAANGAPFALKNTVEIPAHPAPEPEERLVGRGGDETEGWEVTTMSDDQLFKGATESVETIEVAGRSLVCRRIDNTTTLHGQPFNVTFWMSDEVPGGLVRMEDRMGTGQTSKTTVTAFEKK